MPKKNKLSDVYGVARDVPLTYVTRDYVDERFINGLTRDKHIVVFGGSKQGKTCLRKHSLSPNDYIVVQGGAEADRQQIYAGILKEAGATVTVTESRATSGSQKLSVEFSGKGGIPVIGRLEGGAGGELERGTDRKVQRAHFQVDPGDVNDVIRVLKDVEFTKFIVLEDFHYLSEDVQKEIAIDLKAFHEKSDLCVIVVGVWLESNRLVLYNGDLAGRIIPINADEWKTTELMKVIEAGEPLLNIAFSGAVKDELLGRCQGNVGLLQEACYRLCEGRGFFVTQVDRRVFDNVGAVSEVIYAIAEEQSVRYRNFINEFVEGFQATELEMYRWIMFAVISASPASLKRGLKFGSAFRIINAVHPTKRGELYPNNVLQSLNNVGRLQHKKRIQPVILDFSDNGMTVVDSGFLLYLESQEKRELAEMIGCGEAWAELQEMEVEVDLFEGEDAADGRHGA